MWSGAITAEHQRIRRIFTILLPKTFPRVIPVAPLRLELILTTSSGAEVPNATIVSQIIISESLNLLAIEEDPITKVSAPLIKITIPITKRTRVELRSATGEGRPKDWRP